MKKNISINISGIIFHVEEDGYETLRRYLDSINIYFSSYEGSSEIIADLENRIAEIFHSKLSESKQVITAQDVQDLIKTIGQTADFKAAEEASEETGTKSGAEPKFATQGAAEPKLFRDNKRKILGGVCAGISHNLKLDPVWMRLILSLLVVASYGIVIVIYLILWGVLPASDTLEDQPSIKKMYRDGTQKVFGGVAAGVAAYLGTQTSIVRLIFAITALFGFGLVIYIILWIALPEAKTITEKMEMEGKPLTLSNIENWVKTKFDEKETEESTATKIILLPFRAIAVVFKAVGKVLLPILTAIGYIIRFLSGSVITLVAIALLLGILIVCGLLFGIFTSSTVFGQWSGYSLAFPFEAFQHAFSIWTILLVIITVAIPVLLLAMCGLSLLAGKWLINRVTALIFGVLFFVTFTLTFALIPKHLSGFRKDGNFTTEQNFETEGKIPVFSIRESGLDDYAVTSIRLIGHDNKNIRVVEKFEAQGNTKKVAAENAQMVTYQITKQDSTLYFDSNIQFKPGSIFRAQRLHVDVYVPYGQKIVIDPEFWDVANHHSRFRSEDVGRETYMIDSTGLKCLTCPDKRSGNSSGSRVSVNDEYGFSDFKRVNISGAYELTITRGKDYAISVEADDETKEDLEISMGGESLSIDLDEDDFLGGNWKDRKLEITIVMPSLEALEATGAGKVFIYGFEEDKMTISLTGAVSGVGRFDCRDLELDLTGASELQLDGNGNNLEAELLGASSLKAFGFIARTGRVNATGASHAQVNVSDRLEIDETLASEVDFKGSPEVDRH
jgi:phage shock protein PspC (stress-responsive transcriptional regulator)